jgi:thiol:disulfide interchange protein DsbC
MKGKWLGGLLVLGALLVQTSAPAEQASVDPRVEVAGRIPGAKVDQLKATPIPGMYEYTRGTEIAYVTADGKYAISGDLFDLAKNDNLTEQHRRELRSKLIAAVPEDQMLIFGPKDPKYTITVFTDVDCAYCRKLHSDMAELNRLGVRVRYMFYPRSGPNTESWKKAEAVWCSANRNDALTQAKLGAKLDLTKTCDANPVAREYALGQNLGVRGTPAIVTEHGDYLAGYMPPRELVQQLKDLQLAKR